MARILVTNDDGIQHPGIIALEHRLQSIGQVTVVAPLTEMSATSRAMTLTRPLRVHKVTDDHYAVEGTPVDCITMALGKMMRDAPPDIIVSGVNQGANLGDDVLYSGTVAAAAEAIIYGLPGLAVSRQGRDGSGFEPAADFAALAVEKILREGLPKGTILNINVPRGDIHGVRLTRQGNRADRPRIIERVDPRGGDYYWIGQARSTADHQGGTDYEALHDGYISVTPLQNNLTNFAVLEATRSWDLFSYEDQPIESQATR